METLILYTVKVNLSLAIFYLLYALLFRKDTFIKLRRYYFLSAIIFSLSYPLFTVSALGSLIDFSAPPPQQETSVFIGELSMESMVVEDVVQTTPSITLIESIGAIMLIGILFFIFRFLWQLLSIIRIKWRSEKKQRHGYTVYHLQDEITPFSFFNWIFVHLETHTEEELKQILLHEQTHVSQWHSLDVILAEMLCIAFWYNPIVWFMKRDIAINLEYLADNAVLQKGVDTHKYQCKLLQMNYPETAVQLINNFNVSQLKQRIIMMNSKKSPLRKLAKYLSVLPLALLLITANSVYAQQNEPEKETTPPQEPVKKAGKTDEIFVVVEQQPKFPGGTKALMSYISENIKYPVEAIQNRIEGRVILNFIVEKDGSLSNISLVNGIDPLLDAEAIRMVSTMPKWEPGKQKGEIVRVKYTLPVVYKLMSKDDDKSEKEIKIVGSGSMNDLSHQALADKFGDGNPLIIVDDVKMEKGFDINSIKPDDIESISVLKDASAKASYGNEGKDGVIVIVTKPSYRGKITAPQISKDAPDEVFVVVENQPEFPGGMEALMKYLGDNIKYPAEAHKNGIEGRVISNFIVNKDGSISDVNIVRGVDSLLDAEAVRVLSLMPLWKPGTQRGEAVNVRFTIPVVFRLKKDETVDDEAINKLKERGPVTVYEEKNDNPDKGYLKFLGENIKYPVIAQENGIMGVSRATYDVDAKGEISNIKITESVDPSLDAELVRVTKLMPKDIALSKTEGKAASNVAISALFRLQNGNTPPSEHVESDVVVVGYGKPVE